MPTLLVGQLVALAASAAAQCPLTPGCPDDPVCTVQAITSGGVATLIPPDTCVVGHAELITIGERVVGITCDRGLPPNPSKASIGHGHVFALLGEAFPDCDLSTTDAYWVGSDGDYSVAANWSGNVVPISPAERFFVHILPAHPPGTDPNPVVNFNVLASVKRFELGSQCTLLVDNNSGGDNILSFNTVGLDAGFVNATSSGTMRIEITDQSAAGANFAINRINLSQTGTGRIEASGTEPCTLTLIESRINGGTIQVDGAASLRMYDTEISGSNLQGDGTNGLRAINNGSGVSTLQNGGGNAPITNATTLFVEAGAELVTTALGVTLQSSTNTLVPEGRVCLVSPLNLAAPAMGNAQGVIVNGVSGGRQHTIEGAGLVVGRLINRSLIDARALGGADNTLTIDVPTSRDGAESPDGAEVVNYGTLRASNGARLELHGAIENVRSLPNDLGMVAATPGSVVDIQADVTGNGAFQSNLGTIFGGPGPIVGDCVEILPNVGSAFSLAQFDGTNLRMNDLFLRGGTARFQNTARARFDTAMLIGDQSPGALLEILDGAQVDAHGTFTQIAGATHIHEGGALRLITPDEPQSPLTGVFQGGEVRGAGRIVGNVNNSGATIRPGDSPGALAIEAVSFGGPGGDFTQGPGGSLEIEINGPSAGGQFDQLLIDGAAILGGGLVLAINYSPPAVADEWTILRAASITGQFSASVPTDFHLCYFDNRVVLKYLVHCPCTGEITGDGQVNLNDLTTMLSQFGMTGPGLSADLDEDGDVDIGDLTLMLSSFGTTCP